MNPNGQIRRRPDIFQNLGLTLKMPRGSLREKMGEGQNPNEKVLHPNGQIRRRPDIFRNLGLTLKMPRGALREKMVRSKNQTKTF